MQLQNKGEVYHKTISVEKLQLTTIQKNSSLLEATNVTEIEAAKTEKAPPVDAVITWVNGSDPEFVLMMNKFRPARKGEANRFADFVRGLRKPFSNQH